MSTWRDSILVGKYCYALNDRHKATSVMMYPQMESEIFYDQTMIVRFGAFQ